ncbi:MAG: hypothetical protein ACLFQK_01470 [Fibrobacterota bacterium]
MIKYAILFVFFLFTGCYEYLIIGGAAGYFAWDKSKEEKSVVLNPAALRGEASKRQQSSIELLKYIESRIEENKDLDPDSVFIKEDNKDRFNLYLGLRSSSRYNENIEPKERARSEIQDVLLPFTQKLKEILHGREHLEFGGLEIVLKYRVKNYLRNNSKFSTDVLKLSGDVSELLEINVAKPGENYLKSFSGFDQLYIIFYKGKIIHLIENNKGEKDAK